MISLDRLKDIRRLENWLNLDEYGYRVSDETPSQNSEEKKITGYAEFNLKTGEITCYSIK